MNCCICLETTRLTKLNTCSHQFCIECLNNIVDSSSRLNCPLCRQINLGTTDNEELNLKIFEKELFRNSNPIAGFFDNTIPSNDPIEYNLIERGIGYIVYTIYYAYVDCEIYTIYTNTYQIPGDKLGIKTSYKTFPKINLNGPSYLYCT